MPSGVPYSPVRACAGKLLELGGDGQERRNGVVRMMEPDALEAAADTALGACYCAPPPPATDPAAKQPHLAGGKIWSKRGIDVASIHACVWRLATERRAPDASAASTEAAFVWAQNGIMLQEIERLRLQNVNSPSAQSGSCSTLHNNAAS